MPSTSTLPEPSTPLQNPSEAGGSHLDRMQAEVRTLQQQALATQQSLKKLQTREATSPDSAFVSDMQGFASGVNTTMLGAGSALALAAVIVWWYVWRRPLTRWIDAPAAVTRCEPPVSTRAPLSEHSIALHSPGSTQPPAIGPQDDALAWDPNTVSGDTTQPYESEHSPFARHETDVEFDPEAAASEVTRVRKSLAQKREARAQQQDRDDSPLAERGLDLDLNLDEVPVAAFTATEPQAPASDPALDLGLDLGFEQPPQELHGLQAPADDLISFSLVEENGDSHVESQPESTSESVSEPEPAFAPPPQAMSDMEPELGLTPQAQNSGAKGYDFTITLALAQESAALELWNEARDLASEVLESDDPKLVSEALSLLERLNQMELEAPVNTQPWNGTR